jgi:TonB family protein
MAELFERRALAFPLMLVIAGLATAADEPVIDMGPGIVPPRVTHQVNPVYKDEEGFRITGSVIVGLVVSSKGEPKEVHVVRSLEKAVDQAAVEAVQQWQFEAARKDGQPVAVRITVEIRFHSL